VAEVLKGSSGDLYSLDLTSRMELAAESSIHCKSRDELEVTQVTFS
jgi:hypothetical protein